MTQTRRDVLLSWSLALAVFGQGVGIVLLGRLGGRDAVQTLLVAGALALLTAQAWKHRMQLNHRIDMFLVMGAFGGLGMLLGWWADLGFTAPPADAGFHAAMGHASCPHHGGGSPWSMVWTWMTGAMLLAAIPPGLALTRCAELARSGWRRWVSTHLVGNACMVAGMIWIGHWIGPGIARLAGSSVLGGQVGMLLGMLVGMEAGMFLGEAGLGLAPWREWRWQPEEVWMAEEGRSTAPGAGREEAGRRGPGRAVKPSRSR